MNFSFIIIILIVLAPLLDAARRERRDRVLFGKSRRIDTGVRIQGLISINLDTDDFTEAKSILKDLGISIVRRVGTTPFWFIGEATPATGSSANYVEFNETALTQHENVLFWEYILKREMTLHITPTDPAFASQWNLRATPGSPSQSGVAAGADINITSAWDLGVSGQGVHIQFIDDGLESSNSEFTGRYSLSSSWNYESIRQDSTPPSGNSHGTSCAGVAAGAMNNSYCGVGVAYRATVSGVRFIGVSNTTATVADALTGHSSAINISSNSWGYVSSLANFYPELASTFDALASLASRGIPVVFASGNDHLAAGSCARQEMTSGPNTILVAAVNDRNVKSAYSSECPTVFVSAPSSDPYWRTTSHLGIVAPGLSGSCSTTFGGTSAATPTVSGLLALIKEIRPEFTARDMQYLLIQTSDRVHSTDASWMTNAAGFSHSDKYGFGRINAGRATSLARNMTKTVSASAMPVSIVSPNLVIPDGTDTNVVSGISVSLPAGSKAEHVGVYVSINHPSPNQLTIQLTSPSGTVSTLSRPFLNSPAFIAATSGTLYVFASPYWSYTTLPSRINFGSYAFQYYTCDLSALAATTRSNRFVIIASDEPAISCSNHVSMIDTAASKGYAGVVFYSFEPYLNWTLSTAKTASIPSLWIPIWQTNAWSLMTSMTAMTRLSSGFRPSSTLSSYSYFGTWKSFGENPSGSWTLSVRDGTSGTAGTLASWGLEMTYLPNFAPVAPPVQAPVAPPSRPPVAAPLAPPVAPPLLSPTTTLPPTSSPPVAVPQSPPTAPPTATPPVRPPVAIPAASPTQPPSATPRAAPVASPVSSPTALPVPPQRPPTLPPISTPPQTPPPVAPSPLRPVASPVSASSPVGAPQQEPAAPPPFVPSSSNGTFNITGPSNPPAEQPVSGGGTTDPETSNVNGSLSGGTVFAIIAAVLVGGVLIAIVAHQVLVKKLKLFKFAPTKKRLDFTVDINALRGGNAT